MQKSFLLIAHALINKWSILFSHVFTTAGAFLHPLRAILYYLQQFCIFKVSSHIRYIIYMYIYIYIIWDHHLDCLDCFTNFSHCTHRINFRSFFRCPRVSCGFISPVRAVMPLVLRQCNSVSGCPELRYTGHWLSSGRGGMFLYFQATEMGRCWEKCPSWNEIFQKINNFFKT